MMMMMMEQVCRHQVDNNLCDARSEWRIKNKCGMLRLRPTENESCARCSEKGGCVRIVKNTL